MVTGRDLAAAPPRHSRSRVRRWSVVGPAVALAVLLASAAAGAVAWRGGAWRSGAWPGGAWPGGAADRPSTVDSTGPAAASVSPTGSAAPSEPGGGQVTRPAPAPARFGYATGTGPVAGGDGPLRRYRVAVESGTGQDVEEFAAIVQSILGDPRSWIAGGQLRLQQVPRGTAAQFTIYLATPATSEAMCATAGLHTHRFTSCRLPGKVVINLDRWLGAIPDYGAPLGVYRAYAINHEVGHELGHKHEACPGAGQPAPVMQQQTYGLKGCLANGWPYLDGQRYAGPPVP